MAVWEVFRRKPRPPQKVTTGRFEIERNGELAYLEYTLAGNILELTRTEVPEKLRHLGLASSLAETALSWAREHNLKVDIVRDTVRHYVGEHPEYSDLVMH
jgi:predicted GNAT family acetyltransferase